LKNAEILNLIGVEKIEFCADNEALDLHVANRATVTIWLDFVKNISHAYDNADCTRP
jgi:hypothetical protein